MSEFGTVQLAKMCANIGLAGQLKKTFFREAIEARANEIRNEGDSDAQAFTKAITTDETGRALYAAMKAAKGPVVDVDQNYVKPASRGEAHDAMDRLADAHRRGNPTKSKALAYNFVFNHADNRSLAARVRAEHLAPKMPAGGRLEREYPANLSTRAHGRNS
jgi:hypothetical protein